jgi:hypothetical protein
MLNKPSLAEVWPNGLIAANDDYGDRIIVIDPRTKKIVWQYGHLGVASSADGYLSKPDGLDLLPAPQTGRRLAAAVAPVAVHVRRSGSLPEVVSRLAVAPLPGGRVLALGGLLPGDVSSDTILAGTPGALHPVGRLPVRTHDDAAAALGPSVWLFGGGQAVSSNAIVRVTPAGVAHPAGTIGEPLSDLGAAVVGDSAYLVGGYTGAQYASGILRFTQHGTPHLVARLPVGLRYAAVAPLGGKVYVAGGLTTSGASDAVYVFDPESRSVTRIGTLPRPALHATMAALGGALYLVGGDGSDEIVRIDPVSGSARVAGRLPVQLSGGAALTVGDGIDVFGGDGSSAVYRITRR